MCCARHPCPPARPQVCLFLANLRGEAEEDGGLRATCEQYGAVERCFVVRNPAGDSKRYAFCEFTLPASAAACKEAWNRAGDAQRPQAQRDASGAGGGAVWGSRVDAVGPASGQAAGPVLACPSEPHPPAPARLNPPPALPLRAPAATKFVRVKLQRAEPAPVKSVAGLFATVLYVDNMSPVSGRRRLRTR